MRGIFNKPIKNIFSRYLDILGVLDGSFAYKGPASAQIDLTNNCNNDCIGCWCNSYLLGEKKIRPEVKQQTIPYERVVSLIDELYHMGTRHIYYAGGGEPFMHPRIMDIIRYTKKRGLECYVNTNFTLIDEEKARSLVSEGVDSLTVSVWAGTPGMYALTHPSKNEGTFLKIRDTLRFMNKTKKKLPFIKIYNVIFNRNYHELKAMVDFALETHSEAVEFTVIDTIPGKTDSLLLNDREKEELLESCSGIKKQYGNNGLADKLKLLGFDQFMRRISNSGSRSAQYDSDMIGRLPCYAGWAFVRILADGNVNSCLKSHRFPVGNILKEDFASIWNSGPQKVFREKTLKMDKDDPFFSLIGNDPGSRMGCFKSCDNMGHNMDLHGKLVSLSMPEQRILSGISGALKRAREIRFSKEG